MNLLSNSSAFNLIENENFVVIILCTLFIKQMFCHAGHANLLGIYFISTIHN